MKDSSEDNEDHVDSGVVADLVSEEAHERRSSEHAEGEDGVDESNINVTDTNILHMDGQVGQHCISCPSKHE